MKILVSGFAPFGPHKENSSEIIVNSLSLPDLQKIILPVTFKEAFEVLKAEIRSSKPDIVICFGLAHNRTKISLEKVAINLIDCEIPDNNGVLHKGEPITASGKAAYFSTLPLNSMKENLPVEISYSAGTYVCNYVMYRTLELLESTSVKAGFIHLPPLTSDMLSIVTELIKKSTSPAV